MVIRSLVLMLLLALQARAETSAAVDSFNSKVLLSDLASPWTTRADRIFYSGTGLTLLSLAIEHSTNEQFQNEVSSSKPLGESSKFGDLMGQLIPNATYSLGMWSIYYFSDDQAAKEKALKRAIFMFETTLYAASVTTLLKYSVNEPRPNNSDHYSFPSGHSTTIFSFAGVVGLEHEWYYAVPAYALAAFVGFSRINDNMHYLHDVIGGASIGLSYAYGIWYNRHHSEVNSTGVNIFILPTDDLSGSIGSLQWRF